MNRILRLQQKLANKPFGNRIFSYLLARSAPYFLSIRPRVEELRPNYVRARMRKRWAVHNHIKTVHAIACCNLCEFVAGICMEVSIPRHRRWIPAGMEVAYLKKTRTDLTASVDLSEVDWDNCKEVICKVAILDKEGDECVKALIRMKVSDKKKCPDYI
ncbi:MAG: hotdog fold domain-containing protein [Bacteroidota bacterium]